MNSGVEVITDIDKDEDVIVHPRRHPAPLFKMAVKREARIISRLNRTFVTGDTSYRLRLFRIFFQNEDLKRMLIDMMRDNDINATYIDSGSH